MYQVHAIHQARKNSKIQAELDSLSQKRKFSARSKSSKLVLNKRILRLGQIFEKLDSNKDGMISWEHMDTAALPGNLKIAFKPLLRELE